MMKKPTLSPIFLFILKKAVFYLITYFVALSLIFLIIRLMPGNPIEELVSRLVINRHGAPISGVDKLYLQFIEEFGLDKPMTEQYVVYLQVMLTSTWNGAVLIFQFLLHLFNFQVPLASTAPNFNFGVSITFYPITVMNVMTGSLIWSLALLLPAIIIGFYVGNYLGAVAASKKGVMDNVIFNLSLFLSNVPYYCLAFILLYVLAFLYPIFPIGGGYSFGQAGFSFTLDWIIDYLKHYALPFLSLALINIGGQAIGMRVMMIYELNSDYYVYSKQLGLGERKLVNYAYQNAILPQITGLALSFGSIFGGSLVTEIVFNYPGIGLALYNAILSRDYPLIQGCFAIITLTTLLANFVMDIAYAFIDPRIRAVYGGEKA
jgi:peptide/nickel transport system permease protein